LVPKEMTDSMYFSEISRKSLGVEGHLFGPYPTSNGGPMLQSTGRNISTN
jgi:hypothetical protein